MYYLYNGHADVTALIDGAGAIQGTYYYDAFGNIASTTGTVDNPFTYAGYQHDKETGLYYLNARMYDPKTARFMQEDSYAGDINDPLSLNLYSYCHNEPIMYWDPTGHWKKQIINGKTYAIAEEGDTLSGLAKEELGDASKWEELGYTGDPKKLQIGAKIDITKFNSNSDSDDTSSDSAGGSANIRKDTDSVVEQGTDNGNSSICENGVIKNILLKLPGGTSPTQGELEQIDTILTKYENKLVTNYDNDASNTDIEFILNQMAAELTPIFSKHRYDFTWWYEIVKPLSPMDVKNSRSVAIGNENVSIWNLNWSYGGKMYKGDVAGNVLYGYLGTEVFGTGDLGQSILKGGAGAAQYLSDKNNKNIKTDPLVKYIKSMVSGNWGDNPGDSNQIQMGIDSYIKENSYSATVIDLSYLDLYNPLGNVKYIIYPYQVFREVNIEKELGIIRDAELIKRILFKLK